MATKSVPQLVELLILASDNDVTAVAQKMRVSVATLSRWRSGQSNPRPNHARRLNSLLSQSAANEVDLFSSLYTNRDSNRLRRIEVNIIDTLSELRELFHRFSRFSSQHDCLDFISSLFFAHITSLDRGGSGISSSLAIDSNNIATALKNFVSSAYDECLSDSQKAALDERFLSVTLTDSENEFASQIINVLERTRVEIRELHRAGRDDILNEIFSRFLSTSFVDEKEMGQYLTPPEIVHFMVSYGLSQLSRTIFNQLCDPKTCADAGYILDPACGVGSFLAQATQALANYIRNTKPDTDFGEWSSAFFSNNIVGLDKSARMIHLALTNLSLFGIHNSQLRTVNSLDKFSSADMLYENIKGRCGLILTNPPFGAEYTGEILSSYQFSRETRGKYRHIDSEILFFEKYIDWLMPGGILVSIVPDNILTGQGIYADLRKYIAARCDLYSIISLPSVTFAAAGTTTKTSILACRKKDERTEKRQKVYFAACQDVGFEVVTRGGYRRRISCDENDLPRVARELIELAPAELGRWVDLSESERRWDATYHAHPSFNGKTTANFSDSRPKVSDVVDLIDERIHPQRLFENLFPYIEISDIDSRTGWVSAKSLPVEKAPSRARKKVRVGDVLVSTVRPERGSIAVVPAHLDGAICSTGLAVLRCRKINPYLLRRLLTSQFIVEQMERHNVGIAYPAISEKDLLTFILPVEADSISTLGKAAAELGTAFEEIHARLINLDSALNNYIATKEDSTARR